MTSELGFDTGGAGYEIVLKPSPRARVMRLRVDQRTGAVVLTLPRGVSRRKALDWAATKKDWIRSVLAEIPAPLGLVPDAELPLYDIPHRIDWSPERPRSVRVEEGRIVAGGPADQLEARLLRWLKQHALAILERETRHYAAKAGVTVTRVGVGDPSSRWGSCSSSGAIRYSWRLILAPDWVRQATVAHEVAHRVHMNHGPDFHALVASLFERDPTPARLWLRRNGSALHRFGRGR